MQGCKQPVQHSSGVCGLRSVSLVWAEDLAQQSIKGCADSFAQQWVFGLQIGMQQRVAFGVVRSVAFRERWNGGVNSILYERLVNSI